MNATELLKPFGAENDQTHLAILNWFLENNRRVNENELTIMGFKRFKKGQRVWVPIATETIGRKARKLREWGLLIGEKDTSGHSWFAAPQESVLEPVERYEYHPVLDERGRPTGRVRQVIVSSL